MSGDITHDHSVTRAVGRLEGVVAAMAKNADEDREYLRAGFGRLHERLDEQAKELSQIRFGVETGAKIDAQVRSELDEVKKVVEPIVGRDKALRWVVGLVAAGASALGVTLALAADTAKAAVRSWLGM